MKRRRFEFRKGFVAALQERPSWMAPVPQFVFFATIGVTMWGAIRGISFGLGAMSSAIFARLLASFVLRLLGEKQPAPPPALNWATRFLRGFSYFCSESHREDIEDVLADLRRLVKKMRADSRSEQFIQNAVQWHVLKTFCAVVWDEFRRTAEKVIQLIKLLRLR